MQNFNVETKFIVHSNVKTLVQDSFKKDNSVSRSNIQQFNINILKNLKRDKSIIIKKSDKWNGVVILNEDDYISKTEELLNDKSKFMIIKGDWFKYIFTLEDKLNRKIKTKLPENTYNNLFSSGSSAGIIYGLPNIHKEGYPMRPILSATNTFKYILAKFFVPILSDLTTNQFTIKHSY